MSLTTTRPEPAAQTGGAGRNPKPRRDVEVAVNDNYAAFLAGRAQYADGSGFDADFLPNYLFDFQRALVQWAVRQGRGAVFADINGDGFLDLLVANLPPAVAATGDEVESL